jgi:hypothetical protein
MEGKTAFPNQVTQKPHIKSIGTHQGVEFTKEENPIPVSKEMRHEEVKEITKREEKRKEASFKDKIHQRARKKDPPASIPEHSVSPTSEAFSMPSTSPPPSMSSPTSVGPPESEAGTLVSLGSPESIAGFSDASTLQSPQQISSIPSSPVTEGPKQQMGQRREKEGRRLSLPALSKMLDKLNINNRSSKTELFENGKFTSHLACHVFVRIIFCSKYFGLEDVVPFTSSLSTYPHCILLNLLSYDSYSCF